MTRLCLGDYNTRHAGKTWARIHSDSTVLGRCLACPVLIGNKWVANKWVHERGQEFRRPCSLDPMAWQRALTFLAVSNAWAKISFVVCFLFLFSISTCLIWTREPQISVYIRNQQRSMTWFACWNEFSALFLLFFAFLRVIIYVSSALSAWHDFYQYLHFVFHRVFSSWNTQ